MPDVVLLLVLCYFCKSDIDPFDLRRQRMSTDDLGAQTSQVFAPHSCQPVVIQAEKSNRAQVNNITI